MPVVGGLDIHRKQITFDYLDTGTGQVHRGQISPADREHLHAWLARFNGAGDAAFAVEGCDAASSHTLRVANRPIKIRKDDRQQVSCIAEGCECQA
jgi:hypothetical protein